MRIQTSEMLATPDAERVLHVLEWLLRDVSIEVVRDGRRITVRGLGPSQRTMNRNDIAVVEVVSDNQQTVIKADITFQASALLGEVPQDDLVRSKLDRVLDSVKMELRTESVRVERVSWFANSVREPEPELEVEKRITPESRTEPAYAIEHEQMAKVEHGFGLGTGGETEHFVEPVRAVEPVFEPELVHEPEPEVAVAEEASDALPVASENASAAVIVSEVAVEKPIVAPVSGQHEKWAEVPMFQGFQPGDIKPPKRWGLLATVVCMLAAVGLFLAWPYLVGFVHERLNPSSSGTEEGSVREIPAVPAQVPDATAAAAEQNASAHSASQDENDPKVWLESWAEAMRGQDANAQASFYADPVERYALKTNVSNADVWLDKKNAIQGRPKEWTFKLEDVVVEPRPDDSMRVRLTKHITFQPDGEKVSEQIVHSQLKLRKIDGQWKITSEQNLRP